jgi:hypothetical protein
MGFRSTTSVLHVTLQEHAGRMQSASTVPADKTTPPLATRHDSELLRCKAKSLLLTRSFFTKT